MLFLLLLPVFETLHRPLLQAWFVPSWSQPKASKSVSKVTDWQINVFFSWRQNLDSPETPKNANTSDLSRHSKSSLSVTTGFISSTKVAIEKFMFLKNINFGNYLLQSLWWSSHCLKTSLFQFGVFSIFESGFLHNYWLDVFLQSLNLKLLTWVRKGVTVKCFCQLNIEKNNDQNPSSYHMNTIERNGLSKKKHFF